MNKNKLSEFVDSVAASAGLNSEEKTDLLVELTKEAKKVNSDTLKVGLLDKAILDKVLPVSVTPQPDSYYRFLLFLTANEPGEKLSDPQIEKVQRDGDVVVVEVGAVSF